MEYFFTCPYCWQPISMILDSTMEEQDFIEDCEVCCNPIRVRYQIDNDEVIEFDAEKVQD